MIRSKNEQTKKFDKYPENYFEILRIIKKYPENSQRNIANELGLALKAQLLS